MQHEVTPMMWQIEKQSIIDSRDDKLIKNINQNIFSPELSNSSTDSARMQKILNGSQLKLEIIFFKFKIQEKS